MKKVYVSGIHGLFKLLLQIIKPKKKITDDNSGSIVNSDTDISWGVSTGSEMKELLYIYLFLLEHPRVPTYIGHGLGLIVDTIDPTQSCIIDQNELSFTNSKRAIYCIEKFNFDASMFILDKVLIKSRIPASITIKLLKYFTPLHI